MKRIKSILICGLVLALTGVTSLVVAAGGEHDEAFARDSRTGQMRWRPTSVIYSAERGDLAHWFTAIDERTASLITGHLGVRYGTG